MSFDLTGKHAVVLGGTGVLGETLVRGLVGAGARVSLVGRDQTKLDNLMAEVGGGDSWTADASDFDDLARVAKDIANRRGPIDILLAAVGGNRPAATLTPDKGFFDLDLKAYKEVMELNLMTGAVHPVFAFGPHVNPNGASVITVSSVSAELPLTRVGGYGAAKAALEQFTRWTAVEWGGRTQGKVRVNAVQPGFFITEQNRFLLTDKETGELTERGKKIIDHTPAGRFGDPEDLVGAVLYLASDASRFVNGTVLTVDGGFCSWWGV
ncbi:MAG: SDR family oxidoreductase [Armatimonadetes bacterium]|nr:SDR family oxidoreductase [Armatimonadota bacterium]